MPAKHIRMPPCAFCYQPYLPMIHTTYYLVLFLTAIFYFCTTELHIPFLLYYLCAFWFMPATMQDTYRFCYSFAIPSMIDCCCTRTGCYLPDLPHLHRRGSFPWMPATAHAPVHRRRYLPASSACLLPHFTAYWQVTGS